MELHSLSNFIVVFCFITPICRVSSTKKYACAGRVIKHFLSGIQYRVVIVEDNPCVFGTSILTPYGVIQDNFPGMRDAAPHYDIYIRDV
jgi:hypothetical protein